MKITAKPDPSAELVLVTPALAEEWLGKNKENRPLRNTKIASYARSMASGDWLVIHQGVAFDWNGRLMDGQHRLWSVVESNTSVRMFVFRDLNPDAQMVIDTGAKRSAADALHWAQVPGAGNGLAALARHAITWDEGGYRSSASSSFRREITNTEVVEWAQENTDAPDAMSLAGSVRKSLGAPPSVVAFAALLFLRVDPDDANRFFADIANLRTNGKGDPIYTLLKRYETAGASKEQLAAPQHLFFLIRAWNARRSGEQLFNLKAGRAGAAGPISVPEPK